MKIKVKLFGMLADAAKQAELEFENVNDTDSLLLLLKQKHPEINQTKFIIAVNKRVINANCTLHENDEIALLPPFAGG